MEDKTQKGYLRCHDGFKKNGFQTVASIPSQNLYYFVSQIHKSKKGPAFIQIYSWHNFNLVYKKLNCSHK